MFAIVQGTPAAAQLTPPKNYTISPTNVNLMDTTYAISIDDLSIGPLELKRSYLGGQDVSNQYFGNNWAHNYDIWAFSGLYQGQYQVKVIIGRKTHAYWGTTSQNYGENGEEGTTVTLEGGVIVFKDRDGTIYRFNSASNGKISTITSPDGSVLTVNYVSNKPKTIISNHGYALVFDYGGNGTISAACAFNRSVTYVTTATTCASATLKTSYGYSGTKLMSATDVSGYVARYDYSDSSMTTGTGITCLTDPGSTTCKVVNSYTPGTYQIAKQTMADGTIWLYGCSCSFMGRGGDSTEGEVPEDSSGWTDPTGAGASFYFRDYAPIGFWDENAKHYETGYYGGELTSIKPPEGNRVNFNISSRGVPAGTTYKPKTGSTLAPIDAEKRTFPADCDNRITCNKPISIADGNGNQTFYTYDDTHGGVLTETRPAADAASVNPVVRHAYVRRAAWVKNSAGGYSADAPVWLLSEDRTCRTTATVLDACAGGAVDEVVTTYDYGPDSGPNTLLLRGKAVTADGVTLRTCYAYDTQGNKISETSPRAGLASCS